MTSSLLLTATADGTCHREDSQFCVWHAKMCMMRPPFVCLQRCSKQSADISIWRHPDAYSWSNRLAWALRLLWSGGDVCLARYVKLVLQGSADNDNHHCSGQTTGIVMEHGLTMVCKEECNGLDGQLFERLPFADASEWLANGTAESQTER